MWHFIDVTCVLDWVRMSALRPHRVTSRDSRVVLHTQGLWWKNVSHGVLKVCINPLTPKSD